MWRTSTSSFIIAWFCTLTSFGQLRSDTLEQPDPAPIVSLPSGLDRLTAGLDRRFLFLKDTKDLDGLNRLIRVNGVRVGLWLTTRHQVGIGYSFIRQPLQQHNLLAEPVSFKAGLRRLNFFTVYYEPFLIRNDRWDVSLPVDIGWGTSRYEFATESVRGTLVKTGNFIPVGAGVSVTAKLPALPKCKALRWLGINAYAGYRTTLKKDFPGSQVAYRGFFYSVGPTFFLGRFWDDVQSWHRNRKKARQDTD
ncbi:hypothetical protein GCM10023187_17030 [Nibrella viscosa]|uniref:Outer membrane protein beta-barrel domain-containing protein n=1 Tax=Nibrella viscosa TaxID=1084524 RepID=A0ABP8K8G7_9BACT